MLNCLEGYKYNRIYIGGYIGTTYIANYSELTGGVFATCSAISGSSTISCDVCDSPLLEMVLNFLPVAPSTDDEVLILRAAAAKLATPSAANMLALDNKIDTCSAEGQLVMIISSVE